MWRFVDNAPVPGVFDPGYCDNHRGRRIKNEYLCTGYWPTKEHVSMEFKYNCRQGITCEEKK